jgi:hypothetical protein
MIVGLNRVYQHDGREYHVQIEDLGAEAGSYEVRVYEKGSILWRKRVSYTDLVQRGLPRIEQEEALRALMEKTVATVQAAIAKGKLEA